MTIRTAQFFAIVACALALVPSGAHLAELPNKITLAQSEYFIVQGIYSGWAALGALWAIALIANGVLAFVARSQTWPSRFAVLAALCFVLMLAVFLAWTLPGNQSTENWTVAPENWQALRWQWEWSHAANAVIAIAALCLSSLSVISWRQTARSPRSAASIMNGPWSAD